MLLCICLVMDHRWCQNVVRTKKGTWGAAKCVSDALTKFWHLWWSISGQTCSNIKANSFLWQRGKMTLVVMFFFCLSFNRSWVKNPLKCMYNSAYHINCNRTFKCFLFNSVPSFKIRSYVVLTPIIQSYWSCYSIFFYITFQHDPKISTFMPNCKRKCRCFSPHLTW